jgi:tetratricopeptide (TPR) repeat protein
MGSQKTLYSKAVIFTVSLSAALITFLVYLPALQNGFVNWDDGPYVYQNQLIKTIDPAFIKTAFTSIIYYNWHPLTTLSYALDYMVWGLDARGFHLTNLIFHSLNTFLVSIAIFLLTEAAIKKERNEAVAPLQFVTALAAALFFGLHPVHVESVSWVSERKNVLFLFFYLFSVISYLRYQSHGMRTRYILSLTAFALALMSKPMSVSLPLALLIIDLYPLERLKAGEVKKALMEKIPFFALGALSAFITLYAQKGAIVPLEKVFLSTRILVAVRSYAFYLYKTFLPFGLAPFYPYPHQMSFLNLEFIGSAIVLVVLTLFCVFTFKKKKVFMAAWLFYLVTLLPVIGIVQVGGQAAADRYMYMPGLGLFVLAGAGLGVLAEKTNFRAGYPLIIGLSSIVSVFLIILTLRQISVWKDGVTLWTHQTEAYPEAPIGYLKRGVALKDRGLLDEAHADIDKGIELDPWNPSAYSNRAGIHYMIGDYSGAVNDISKAIELNPGEPSYYANIDMIYRQLGDTKRFLKNIR